MRRGRFRVLYVLLLAGGILWIVQTRPLWLDPMRVLDEPKRPAATAPEWQRSEEARLAETNRRIQVVFYSLLGVMVLGELTGFALWRLGVLRR